MPPDLLSKRTRLEFRDFLSSWTLRQIEKEFDSAEIARDREFRPSVSGERRALVEQYYHSLDFSSPSDMRKLVAAYESILYKAKDNIAKALNGAEIRIQIDALIRYLKSDGFIFQEGKLSPSQPHTIRAFSLSTPSRLAR